MKEDDTTTKHSQSKSFTHSLERFCHSNDTVTETIRECMSMSSSKSDGFLRKLYVKVSQGN